MDTKVAHRKIESVRILALGVYIVEIMLLVLAIAFFFKYRSMAFPSIIVALLFYWIVVLRVDKAYSKTVVKMNLIVGTGNLFDKCVYKDKGGVERSDIRESGMLPTKEEEGNEVVSGPTLYLEKDGIDILVSNIIAYYPLARGVDKHKVALLKGLWLSSDFDALPADAEIAIERKNSLHKSIEDLFYIKQNMECKSQNVSGWWDEYNVYCKNISLDDLKYFLRQARSIVDSILGKDLHLFIRLHQGKIYIFVSGRNLSMDFPIYKGPSLSFVEKNRIPEVVALKDFISCYSKK